MTTNVSTIAGEFEPLTKVVGLVELYWQTNSINTQLLLGSQYLEDHDAANAVVIVPTSGEAAMAPLRIGAGGLAYVDMGFLVYVWGIPSDERPLFRWETADIISSNVFVALHYVATGRIRMRNITPSDDTRIVRHGEQYVWACSYAYQINRAALQALPPNVSTVVAGTIKAP
jgi:hypothetical protein